jgi:hypothetical protein
MPPLLTEIYRLQEKLTGLDDYERNLLKMCANLLESRYEVPEPRNLIQRHPIHRPARPLGTPRRPPVSLRARRVIPECH